MSGATRGAVARWAWFALIVTLLVPVWWGADITAPWDVDNIAPGSVLKSMAAHFGPSWHSSYGPLPYYLNAAVYAPLLAAMKLGGELGHPASAYPWGFAHPQASALWLVVTTRLVTLLLALGVAWLASREALRKGQTAGAAWVPMLLLGSAVFVYYARTSNVDLYALFWLWLGFHWIEEPGASPARLALGAAAATLAMCCKEQVAPISLVAVAWAASRAGAPRSGGGYDVRAVSLVAVASIAAYAIMWRLPFGLPGWLDHHRFIFTQAKYPRSYPLTAAGLGALGAHCARLLPLALGPALLVLTTAALLVRVSWNGLGARAIGCALYLAAFVGSIGYVYPRFLLPLLLLALPLSLGAIGAIATRLQSRPTLTYTLAAILVALTLAGGPTLSAAMLGDPRNAAEHWLTEHLAPGERLELTGNAHFTVRVPHGMPVIRTEDDSLRLQPRGPIGDVVLTSSLSDYEFTRDSTIRHCYWDSLHAGTPRGRYREAAVFRGPVPEPWLRGLPVAPTIRAFRRLDESAILHDHGATEAPVTGGSRGRS